MTTATAPDNDILDLVAEEIAAAQVAGIPACDLPKYVVDRLRLRTQSCYQYIRKRALSPTRRAAEICNRFTGTNGKDLAAEYNLSLRRVEQIVNKNRNK